MAQNFLYMFEFVVDDIVIVKQNKCAPEEYPTCCEITFRNNVFVSIYDKEYGQYTDPCKKKCGKTCLFSLESPVSEEDKLDIHVYKKRTDRCKFLLGSASMPIKHIFDKVKENFDSQNLNWENLQMHSSEGYSKAKEFVDDDCDSNDNERQENLCPSFELIKQFVPLFKEKCQTGNMSLLIRLVAVGPSIVSTFPFTSKCSVACKEDCLNKVDNKGMNGCNSSSGSKKYKNNNGCMPVEDPCDKVVKKSVCQRYFACNEDKGRPFDEIEDDFARAAKNREQKAKRSRCTTSEPSSSCECEECFQQCQAVENASQVGQEGNDAFSVKANDNRIIQPCSMCDLSDTQSCFQIPCQGAPKSEAYDEFEALLNGSCMVIRVLKDTHEVQNICDGTEDFHEDNNCTKNSKEKNMLKSDCNMANILRNSNFTKNHIKRRTGGHIINHPNLPKIRANLKYSGNEDCYPEKYYIPCSTIKSYCNDQSNKINNYRSYRAKLGNVVNSDVTCLPKHRKEEKNCCVQASSKNTGNSMKDLDEDAREKGIQVCYKTCDETESDVFLVKLGSKHKNDHKKNNIEIELRTPKMPVTMAKQHVTTETQLTEEDLDGALANASHVKKGKGKGKKKKK